MRTSPHLLLALLVVLLRPGSGRALTGASEVPDGSWPSVALLDNGCTGVLVHPTVIVSAAHCVPAPVSATFGPFVDGSQRGVRLRDCRRHPEGAPGTPFDLSYCLLEDPAHDVPIVPLVKSPAGVGEGSEVVVVGFGRDAEKPADGTKRELHARIESLGDTLFVGGSAGSICEGDSGAPAFAEGTDYAQRIIGIASATYSPECDGTSGIFVFVPNVLEWLEESTGLALSVSGNTEDEGE